MADGKPDFLDFDKLAARHLSQNDVRSILEAAHHLSINGIQKPSSATRSVSGKHKSNSTLDSPKRISRSGKICKSLFSGPEILFKGLPMWNMHYEMI